MLMPQNDNVNILKGVTMSTLKDVAKEVGVSMITVSRVVNTPEKVKPQTRLKIEIAMKKLKYSPNPVAKAMVYKRVGIIDVYIPEDIELSNPFVMHFIAGISEVLSKKLYSLLVFRNRDFEHSSDGSIATGLLKNEVQDMYLYTKERGRPLVLFGHTDIPDVDCVDVDNVAGAKAITQYLIEQGHIKIAMINVDENKDYTQDRLSGFCQALVEHNLSPKCSPVIYSRNDVQGGYSATKELLAKGKYTAIFCATDVLAIGAVQAIVESGQKVPEDISVTGFDGLGYQLLSKPNITTVYQPVFQIGRILAETLLERIKETRNPTKILIMPEIYYNNSVRNILETKKK